MLSMTCTPVPPTPGDHAIFEGWLADNYLGQIDPEQSARKVLGVCFVAEGTFEFRIDVVEVGHDGRPSRDREKQVTSSFVTAIVG